MPRIIGCSIRRMDYVSSTNSLLRAEAELEAAPEGAALLAEYQTAGRGRLNRSWEAPPGKSLLLSVLLYPQMAPAKIPLLSLGAALAVQEALKDLLSQHTNNHLHTDKKPSASMSALQLKWPNDILYEGKKLCGILCESGSNAQNQLFVVIGIGLNVNQGSEDFSPELRPKATSLYLITGNAQPRETLLGFVLDRLEELRLRLLKEGADWIVGEWMPRAGIIGRCLTVSESSHHRNSTPPKIFTETSPNLPRGYITGICRGLTPEGGLMLELMNGSIITIYSGDIL